MTNRGQQRLRVNSHNTHCWLIFPKLEQLMQSEVALYTTSTAITWQATYLRQYYTNSQLSTVRYCSTTWSTTLHSGHKLNHLWVSVKEMISERGIMIPPPHNTHCLYQFPMVDKSHTICYTLYFFHMLHLVLVMYKRCRNMWQCHTTSSPLCPK